MTGRAGCRYRSRRDGTGGLPSLRTADSRQAASAVVIGSVILGHGTSVWFNGVVRGDDAITIGDGTNVYRPAR